MNALQQTYKSICKAIGWSVFGAVIIIAGQYGPQMFDQGKEAGAEVVFWEDDAVWGR